MHLSWPVRAAGVTFLVLTGIHAEAADIRVPADAPSIQAAIALAQAGDRVLVDPGTWPGPVDFGGKDIVVESLAGPADTVIDGEGAAGFVVTFANGEGRDAVLRGFTVTGGFGQGGSMGAGPGGGVRIVGASPTLEGNLITGNAGVLGGGVSVVDGAPALVGNSLSGNTALQGGGLYVQGGALDALDNRFEDNTAVQFGGGAAVLWGAAVRMTDSLFVGNTASSFGGGLYAGHASLDLVGNDFIGNGRADAGSSPGSWILRTSGGGAIYATGSSGRIDRSRLLDNVAAFGTALYVAGGGNLEILNSLFAGNALACGCGTGVVYANAASPRLVNITLADNGGFVGVFTTYNAFPSIANSILAGQVSPTAGNGQAQLAWSLYQGTPFAASLGDGNREGDPLLDAQADWAPLAGSPAIDAGDNFAVPADVLADLAGNPRFRDDPDTPDSGNGAAPLVDLGAIEFDPGAALVALHASPAGREGGWDITVELGRPARLEVHLLDGKGNPLRRLADADHQPGTVTLHWNGTGPRGAPLPPGDYLIEARAGHEHRHLALFLGARRPR
ncbi:MAG: hypothetical protein KF823_03630 [Xanthomonadales bacterium]|nr:hypothetical protein [Xanthomonadales bacterium]